MLQRNHCGWIDRWVPLQNIGARHPTPYVATEHRHVRQDSLFSATVLLSTSECQQSPG